MKYSRLNEFIRLTSDSAMLVEFFYEIDKHFNTTCLRGLNCSRKGSLFDEKLNEFELAKYLGKLTFSILKSFMN